MPQEDGSDRQAHHNVESGHGDDGDTIERSIWRHPRLIGTRHALLILAPLGIAAGLLHWPHVVIFFLNFFAIIPLAPSIVVTTRRLADHTRPGFGGFLKVILGNAVEIIVSTCSVIRGLFTFTDIIYLDSR